MIPRIMVGIVCVLSAVIMPSAGQTNNITQSATVTQNRSERADGTLVVHVSKIDNLLRITRESSAFAMTTNGPQQAEPETLKAKPGYVFLKMLLDAKAQNTEFVLDTAQMVLVKPDGTTISPTSFSFPGCMACMAVVGMTLGGPGSTSSDFGPYEVTFLVPQTGEGDFLFRVSGIDVGTIGELKGLLRPAPVKTRRPKKSE